MGALSRFTRRALRPLARPVAVRYASLHEHIDALDQRLDGVEQREHALSDQMAALLARLVEMEQRVRVDAEMLGQFSLVARRTVDQLAERLDAIDAALDDTALDRRLREQPALSDRAAFQLVGTALPALGPGLAALLNWASGDSGPAAQAGHELTPPVAGFHRAGGHDLAWINERIVEAPYVFAALADLPAASRVLDLGATGSSVAVSLASLGHRVTVVDPRPYPFHHPNLIAVATPAQEWDGPAEPFDAVVALSTIEHLGLAAYGDEPRDEGLDRRVVERVGGWLRPDGRLVLTVPYGPWSVDGLQRIYDDDHLTSLLAGWKIVHEQVLVQPDPTTWLPATGRPDASDWDDNTRGVVLLTTTRA